MTVSGTVTHWINGVTCMLPEGSLVFIRPDDIHGYIYDNPDSSHTSYINFAFNRKTAEDLFAYLTDSFPSKYLTSCDMPPMVVVNSREKKHLLRTIGELNTADWNDKGSLKIRTRVILADIFARLFYNFKREQNETIPLWLSDLMRTMEQPDNFIAGIGRMTELSKKSREHLSRSLKKHFDITPSEYVNSLRINYAANLLINTNTQVIDICYNCGFMNLSHFYRIFKNAYTLSPREFRKKYKIV